MCTELDNWNLTMSAMRVEGPQATLHRLTHLL